MTAQLLVMELDRTLDDCSKTRRAQILSRVTDLFLSETQYSDEQICLYDEVMGRLIQRIETDALAQLSERLAVIDWAPPNLVLSLARHDEIAVSCAVLAKSNRLRDDDLVAIAQTKSQDHLLAICCRGRLSEPITDVLVARGNAEVARTVFWPTRGLPFPRRDSTCSRGVPKRMMTSRYA
jgi:uncharacterized protein (DUF2336 family)